MESFRNCRKHNLIDEDNIKKEKIVFGFVFVERSRKVWHEFRSHGQKQHHMTQVAQSMVQKPQTWWMDVRNLILNSYLRYPRRAHKLSIRKQVTVRKLSIFRAVKRYEYFFNRPQNIFAKIYAWWITFFECNLFDNCYILF